MSLKEELYEALEGHGVKYIDTNTRSVEVYATDREDAHVFALEPDTTLEDLVSNIKQHLRNRT